jgi:diguanylate cyclase (GGDEF)-like protein
MEVKIAEHQKKKSYQPLLETNEKEELCRLIFECSADAIIVSDRQGTIRLLNHNVERFFDLPADQILGRRFLLSSNSGETKEVTTSRPGKDTSITEIRSTEIKQHGETLYASTFRDITELVRLREELRALVLVDDLVNLCNRRGFFMLAEQQLRLANRTKKGLYLILISLDNYKSANGTSDQEAGNRLLVQTAAILKDTFRKSDIIARISEDIFAIMATEAQPNSADIMARRLLDNLEKYNAKVSPTDKLLASMGVACYDPENHCSLDELLSLADMQLYRQKRGERKSALLWYLAQTNGAQEIPKRTK